MHQQTRIREIMTVQQSSFPRIKDIAVVEESLHSPSPEFSLDLESHDPLSTPKGTFPLWILKGEKIPLQERFIFAVIDKVNGKIDPQYEFEVLEDGRLQIFGRSGVRTEYDIPFVEARPYPAGSPIQYAIVSKEKYTCATVEFIPYPLEASGPDGEHLDLQVTHPMGTHFSLSAQGFSPNEKLLLSHTSGDLVEEKEVIADEQGSFSIGLNPTILGRLGGDASLKVIGETKELQLDYPWGARLEKRAFKEKRMFPILFVVNRSSEELDQKEIERNFTATFFR